MKTITIPKPLGELNYIVVLRQVILAQPSARQTETDVKRFESICDKIDSLEANPTPFHQLEDEERDYLKEQCKLTGMAQLPYPLSRMIARVQDAIWEAVDTKAGV